MIPAGVSHTSSHGSITDVSVHWPTLGEVWEVLSFQAGYNTNLVMLGTAFLGIGAGTIGAFALLRKRALVADALSHATLPGVAIAFLIGSWMGVSRSLPLLLLGAVVSGVIGALCVQLIVRYSRIREDAAIGAVLSVFFGVGVVLLSYIQNMNVGNQGGLASFIYGQAAAMSQTNAIIIGATSLFACLLTFAFFKEFRVLCFDSTYAAAQGWPVQRLDLLLLALIAIITVIGIQAVGLILVVAMVIIPPAAARFWTERLGVMTIVSATLGGLAGYLGAAASALLERLPTGAVIVLIAGGIFTFSMIAAPARGFVAHAARRARLRLLILEQHILRKMHEQLETVAGGADRHADASVSIADLASERNWSTLRLRVALRWLSARGLLNRHNHHVSLTESGAREAARTTRNHRLWEAYLVRNADIAPSHVDTSADLVEHVLGDQLVQELERELKAEGVLLPSPHPIVATHSAREGKS